MQDPTIVAFITLVVALVALLVVVALTARADLTKARRQFDAERQRLLGQLAQTKEECHGQIVQIKEQHGRQIDEARRDATDKSRWVLKGQAAEIMVSHLPNFMYLPADMHFIGYPIDYIVFNGLTDLRDNGADGSQLEIVLLEIKQGQARLHPHQEAIKRSIEDKRVKFVTISVDDNANVRDTRSRW